MGMMLVLPTNALSWHGMRSVPCGRVVHTHRLAPVRAVAAYPTRATVRIKTEPFPDNNVYVPDLLGREIYLQAKVPEGWAYSNGPVGGVGMQMLVCDADGINSSGLTRGKGLKSRAVVSCQLFVAPNFRRQGLAQRLLRELEGRARLWGATEMLLPVDAQNTAAVHLYSKMGYRRTPGTSHRSTGEVCMRRFIWSPDHHTLKSMLPQHTTLSVM